MRSYLAAFSVFINERTGGEEGQYLCARIAHHWGERCLFCRFIAWALSEEDHCAEQLAEWLGKK